MLHLVGFLSSRFTHDARSQEHKTYYEVCQNYDDDDDDENDIVLQLITNYVDEETAYSGRRH